jgi:hypothetical protein
VKSGSLSARVTRDLISLYERRHTAEYSPRAAWEFTPEEEMTYLGWMQESAVDILKELQKNAPEHKTRLKEIKDKTLKARCP